MIYNAIPPVLPQLLAQILPGSIGTYSICLVPIGRGQLDFLSVFIFWVHHI